MDNTKFLKSVTQGYRNCAPLFGGEANVSLYPATIQYLRGRSLDPEFLSACGIVRCLTAEAQIDLHEYHPSAEIGDLIVPVWGVATGGALADVRLWRVRDGERRARFRGADTIPGNVMANDAARRWLAGESVEVLEICEGEPDLCARVQAKNNSAVIGIVNMSWTPELGAACERAGRIVILTDDDEAGERYAKTIYRSLSPEAQARCVRYRAPEGVLNKKGQKPDQNDLLEMGLVGEVYEYAPAPEPEPAPLTPAQIVASERRSWRDSGDRGWVLAKMAKWWFSKWPDVLTAASQPGGTNAGKGGGGWPGLALPVLRAAAGWDSLRHELVTPEQVAMAGDGYLCLDLWQMETELIAAAKLGAEAHPKATRSKARGDRLQTITGSRTGTGARRGGIVEKAMKGPLGFDDFTRMHVEKRTPKEKPPTKTVTVSIGRTAGTTVTLEVEDKGAPPPPSNPGGEVLSAAKRQVSNRRLIKNHFPTAPCHDSATIPNGYEIREDGSIWREALDEDRPSRDPVCSAPILVVGAAVDQDGLHWREVAWLEAGGGWGSQIVSRHTICDRAKIVAALADSNGPVNSTYAAQIVAFLDRYEAANLERIPQTRVATRMGWLDKGGFMLGSDIFVDGEGVEVDATAPRAQVRYHNKDGGDRQEGRAFSRKPKGTWEGWVEAASRAKEYPTVLYGLFASLAAPLVSLLEMPTVIVDFAGPSTGGKTSVLMLSASVWGDPAESGAGADGLIMRSWDNTATGIERIAAGRCHLPVLLNDTKKAPARLDVGKVIFTLHEGTGTGRGSVSGLAGMQGWRTVVVSTGEQRLVDFAGATDGGVHARVLQVHGFPWGALSDDMRTVVDGFRVALQRNHGWAGRRWVAWLAKNKGKVSQWQAECEKIFDSYTDEAKGSPLAARAGRMAAAVTLAARLSVEALGFDLGGEAACNQVFRKMITETRTRSVHEKALYDLWNWSVMNEDKFFNENFKAKECPRDGWVGRWDQPKAVDDPNWTQLEFAVVQLEVVLKRLGYDASQSIRNMWDSMGWLEVTEANPEKGTPRRRTKKRKIGKESADCVVIPRKVLESLGIVGEQDPSEAEAEEAKKVAETPGAKWTPATAPTKPKQQTLKPVAVQEPEMEPAPQAPPKKEDVDPSLPLSALPPDHPNYCPF
jgi:5S rRNA maturation endonuclease (ribonuclease M5)